MASGLVTIPINMHGVVLGYYSNMASGLVTIPIWRRARLVFQHGVGLGYYSRMASCSVSIPTWPRARTLSLGPTYYEQCLHLSE